MFVRADQFLIFIWQQLMLFAGDATVVLIVKKLIIIFSPKNMTVGVPLNSTAFSLSQSLICINYTNATSRLHDTESSLTLWFTLSCLLHIIAVVSNAAFVWAVYNDRTSQVGPRLLLSNLALSGFLLSAIGFPMVSVASFLAFQGIDTPCLYYLTFLLFLIATSWADVMLALNRFIAICLPHYYFKWRTTKASLCLISCSWTVAIALVGLVAARRGASVVMLPDKTCALLSSHPSGVFYTLTMNLIPYGPLRACRYGFIGYIWLRLPQTAGWQDLPWVLKAGSPAPKKTRYRQSYVLLSYLVLDLCHAN